MTFKIQDVFSSKKIVPLIAVLLLSYLTFAAFYSLAYEEIYKHHSHASAIILWILLAICEVFMILYWVLLFKRGPGRAPVMKPFDLYGTSASRDMGQTSSPHEQALSPLPEYFSCDENGFPFWCSNCQSVKLPRSFHSKDLGYCTLKFDHYCVWVGSPIGQDNYGYFLKFVLWSGLGTSIMLVYLAVYTKSSYTRANAMGLVINKNFIFMYIISGFFSLFLITLFGSNIYFILKNATTLDDMAKKQSKRYARWQASKDKNPKRMPRVEDGKRYVNIRSDGGGDNERLIVKYDVADHPYSYGFVNNWINVWMHGNSSKVRDFGADKFKLFCWSTVIFLVPLVDVWRERGEKGQPRLGKDDEEGLDSKMIYEKYSDTFGVSFKEYIDDKIKTKEAYKPKYLKTIENSQSSEGTPSKDID